MSECFVCSRTAPDGTNYCTRCADTLAGELLKVPGLVVDLGVAAARLDKLGRERAGGKSAEVPLPITLTRAGHPVDYSRPLAGLASTIGPVAWELNKLDRLRLVDAVTAPGLAQLVHNNRAGDTARPDAASIGFVPVHALELSAVWLACHIVRFRSHPSAHLWHNAIVDAVEHATRAVDRLPERVLKGICRHLELRGTELVECGADLYVERGADWVRCDRCRMLYDVRTLEADALSEAEAMLFTLGEIERLMRTLGEPVARSTLYEWAGKKWLKARGWKHAGKVTTSWIHRNDPVVFRLGDVRDLRRRTGV